MDYHGYYYWEEGDGSAKNKNIKGGNIKI